MLAFTKTRASEVEAQHRKSEMVKRLHGMKNNFVVQCPAIQRVRMTDHRRVRRRGRSGVEEGLQASGRAIEEKRANAGSFGGHRSSVVVGLNSIAELSRLTESASQRLATDDQPLLRSSHGFVRAHT